MTPDASPAWHRSTALQRAVLALDSLASLDRAQMEGHREGTPEREWHRQQWAEMCRIRDAMTRAPGYRMEQEG